METIPVRFLSYDEEGEETLLLTYQVPADKWNDSMTEMEAESVSDTPKVEKA